MDKAERITRILLLLSVLQMLMLCIFFISMHTVRQFFPWWFTVTSSATTSTTAAPMPTMQYSRSIHEKHRTGQQNYLPVLTNNLPHNLSSLDFNLLVLCHTFSTGENW